MSSPRGLHDRPPNRTEIIAINGTISGPLLNATLVTEIFTETTFPGTDGSYVELANRYVWYTTDGVPFAGHEIGFVNARGTITKPVESFSEGYQAKLQADASIDYLLRRAIRLSVGAVPHVLRPTRTSERRRGHRLLHRRLRSRRQVHSEEYRCDHCPRGRGSMVEDGSQRIC